MQTLQEAFPLGKMSTGQCQRNVLVRCDNFKRHTSDLPLPPPRATLRALFSKKIKRAMSEIPKTYEPPSIEAKWYAFWEQNGCFAADPKSPKPAYSIVIPPPSVGGYWAPPTSSPERRPRVSASSSSRSHPCGTASPAGPRCWPDCTPDCPPKRSAPPRASRLCRR
jgi:hypothetical protein